MNRRNTRKDAFLASIPCCTVESKAGDLKKRISFNFSFFDAGQSAGQDFKDWSHEQLSKLLDKLKSFSKESVEHWRREHTGHGSQHVLEVYGAFPGKSDFIRPKHVPADIDWARFRLEFDCRLIGFLLKKEHCSEFGLDPNIFYVVFLDEHHRFYQSE
jgi:hypothetical protein